MALTYLQLCNRVLKRIGEAELSTVSGATGKGKMVGELLNEAQNYLFTLDDWYTLFKTRVFKTVTYTASTIAFSENGASADTITDSDSAFVTQGFTAGMQVYVSGSSSNDGIYVLGTVAAGTLTLQTADDLTTEAAGSSVTIYAVTYPVASDWGRSIDLCDVTNNRFLEEDYSRSFSELDPDNSYIGIPASFCLNGRYYRMYPIADGDYNIRDRYWQLPDTLSSDSDTSDLPIECENAMIHYAWAGMCEYLQKYETADRIKMLAKELISQAMKSNKRMINKMHVFRPSQGLSAGITRPKFPSHYPRGG